MRTESETASSSEKITTERVDLQVFNCLPTTLAHYAHEIRETFGRLGITVNVIDSASPIDSDARRITRAVAHLREIFRISKGGIPTLVIWPAFGWLEGAFWGRGSLRSMIVAHDPTPIRRQFLSGRVATTVAARLMSTSWVCHTEAAAVAASEAIGVVPRVALHPILNAPGKPIERKKAKRSRISVIGQYKPLRDLDTLRGIAENLSVDEFELKIVGRGWPSVDGWEVVNRFVDEDELDSELDATSVLLIPYKQYWQSGVAVRAVERGTAVVGEGTEFLTTLLGESYPGIVAEKGVHSWITAIRAADGYYDAGLHQKYMHRTDESWKPIAEILKYRC